MSSFFGGILLGKPDQKMLDEIYRRHLPIPENIFEPDSSVNVTVDEKYLNETGCVPCLGTPNDDGTLTLTFNDEEE